MNSTKSSFLLGWLRQIVGGSCAMWTQEDGTFASEWTYQPRNSKHV